MKIWLKLILMIILIVAIVIGVMYLVKSKYNDAEIQTIKTDMLLVEWKVKDYMGTRTVNSEETNYLGTKVSEMQENIIIEEFLSKNIISEEEYDKYYVLQDKDMAEAGLEITNYEDCYYLINYENYEVIITKGVEFSKDEMLYKLSDIEEKTSSNEDLNSEDEENIQNENTETEETAEETTEEVTEGSNEGE